MARRTQHPWQSASLAVLLFAGCATPLARAQDSPPLRASEQPWRELVGTDLSRVEVQLVAIREDGELVARERDGAGVRRPLRDVLALLPLEAGEQSTSTSLGVMTLTSGASLPGQFQGVSTPTTSSEPTIRWASPALGTLEASLEHVHTLWLDAAPIPRSVRDRLQGSSQDLVLLANGDLREGFVELVGTTEEAPRLRIEHAGQTATVDFALVRALALANPPIAPRGMWAWIDDGSAVPVESAIMLAGRNLELRVADSTKDAAAAGSPVELDPSLVRTILFDRTRVRGLDECTLASEASDPNRRYTPPAVVHAGRTGGPAVPFGLAYIELPGPMRVRCELPAGAVTIDGLLELPEDCRTFGSVNVIMTQDGREISRVRLDSAQPTASFRGTLAGAAPLVILVDDAGDGSIEDRVLVRRTLIAIAP